MGADHRQRLGLPVGRGAEAAVGRTLEKQRAVGQQRAGLHGLAHGGGDVAEVFTHHQALVARALQREDAE